MPHRKRFHLRPAWLPELSHCPECGYPIPPPMYDGHQNPQFHATDCSRHDPSECFVCLNVGVLSSAGSSGPEPIAPA